MCLAEIIKLLPKNGDKISIGRLRELGYKGNVTNACKEPEGYKVSYQSPHIRLRTLERTAKRDRKLSYSPVGGGRDPQG